MTPGWIKLTEDQCLALHELRATCPNDNMLRPTLDASGAYWLAADCLDEINGLFAHYASMLSTLTVTQQEMPEWPDPA